MKDTIIAVLLNLSFAGCMAYGVFGGLRAISQYRHSNGLDN
ncbi:hypothetical protein [Providencia sp. PROV258]|nr:hypothetical protein [Providencia sp. PROV258]